MSLVGNISCPNLVYLQCVLDVEKEREFPSVFTSDIKEVKQTASVKFRLFLIEPITDNHQ